MPASQPASILNRRSHRSLPFAAVAGLVLAWSGALAGCESDQSMQPTSPDERAAAEFARDPGLAKVTTVEALASFYRAESRGLIRPTTIDRAADALRAQEV